MGIKSPFRKMLRLVIDNSTIRKVLSSNSCLLPSFVWKRLPFQGIVKVSLPEGHSFKYKATYNDSIGRALFWRGFVGFEYSSTQLFYRLAQKSKIILDIGSNTGVYSLLAASANDNAQIFAFEPVPHIHKMLIDNIKLNNYDDRCYAKLMAVGDFKGHVKFHVPVGDCPTSASLNITGFRGAKGYLIDTVITTIDDVCCEKQLKVDLIKIDVEGFEDRVLKGMKKVLTEFRPNIIMECNYDGPYKSVEQILKAHGYKIYHIEKIGPVFVENIYPSSPSGLEP